jgi:hypothetical protein
MKYSYSIQNPLLSDKTIEQLLAKGYIGVSYELSVDIAFAAAAYKYRNKIKWIKTEPDEDGTIALMTLDLPEFNKLLQFMLDKFGWCPMVYSSTEKPKVFIFTPQNEIEEAAIAFTIEGEYGWKESLYSLEYAASERDRTCMIFSTKPKTLENQEWLLVIFDRKNNTKSWSCHDGSFEQVYYRWAEEIEGNIPNYNPTTDEILNALADGSKNNTNAIVTAEEVRTRIKKELNGNNIPRKSTIEKWLQESGQDGIEKRIQEHLIYWKNKTL